MLRISTGEMITKLSLIAIQDCTCTKKQQTGKDPTVCVSCEIGGILNDIDESVEYEYKRFIKE